MCLSKLRTTTPHRNIHVTSESPVGDISVVTLIRTDTTLDHSQKAEKIWCEERVLQNTRLAHISLAARAFENGLGKRRSGAEAQWAGAWCGGLWCGVVR